ncbi:MAG: NAD(P)/FAD-dependent oxidoreductase [Gammaproteobacteria bacterium]|nr:NAD(P)/FAD-dependent oxidoreductase [Gammaproteobacteria bacterium]MYC25260.1 NAD(P)/FAD-dependent oxidoreductase [Gammaproteobacteria bacterium]
MIDTESLIIGAGPCGLFQVFELGLQGIKAHIVDALPEIGGQCTALYPDKPIYDIPAIPVCSAEELVSRLSEQIQPFEANFHLDQQVVRIQSIDPNTFRVETSKGTVFQTKSIVIAGGVGSFQAMPLRAKGAEEVNSDFLHYRITDKSQFAGKRLVILGGGDSALDWALELVDVASSLTLIHRSEKFRAAEASVQRMRDLVADNAMDFFVGNATNVVSDNGKLREVHITKPDREVESLLIDHLLVFFGLSPKLGPIADWGLEITKNQIETDTEKFETNIPGVYAVGDIANYPGKKKLILSGFHEAALVSFAIKKRLFPEEKAFLQYTTTSPLMHQRLGLASPPEEV